LGSAKGKFVVPDDFNDPLPEEIENLEMKVLLDTHTFLWAITEETRLSQRVRLLLLSAELWFSVVSLWEILTNVQIGKLSLPRPAGRFVTEKLAFKWCSYSSDNFAWKRMCLW
jgi:hypothetical protein